MVDSTEIFFYGLFMDMTLLSAQGLHPRDPRHAHVDGYGLRIGERATLVVSPQEQAFGIVAKLTRKEIDALYSGAGVADYRPEEVSIQLENGERIPALCYNLPAESIAGRNVEYARKLLEVAQRLAFPEQYLGKLRELAR